MLQHCRLTITDSTAIPATAPPALDRCSSTEQSEDEDAVRLRDVCSSLYQVYSRMTDKLSLGSPRTTRASEAADHLEDRVYRYASKLHRLDPVHFCILDRTSLSTIVVDEDVQAAVLDRVPGLPAFPHALEIALSRYDRVCLTVPGIQASNSDSPDASRYAQPTAVVRLPARVREIPTSTGSMIRCVTCSYPVCSGYRVTDVDLDTRSVGLITETNSLLGLANLNEGVWETLVYAPIWDAYFSRLPDVLLQRYSPSLPKYSHGLSLTQNSGRRYRSLPPNPSRMHTSRMSHATTAWCRRAQASTRPARALDPPLPPPCHRRRRARARTASSYACLRSRPSSRASNRSSGSRTAPSSWPGVAPCFIV